MGERRTPGSVAVAVHDAAVRLLITRLAGRGALLPGWAHLAGVSLVAARRIVVERRRGSCETLSALCAAAGIPREDVWLAAGVTPYTPRPQFRDPLPVRGLLWFAGAS